MMVASEAEEAWWPPTFRPSTLGLIWLAWWIVHDDSHSTLRVSAVRISVERGEAGMANDSVSTARMLRESGRQRVLKFSLSHRQYWKIFPNSPLSTIDNSQCPPSTTSTEKSWPRCRKTAAP